VTSLALQRAFAILRMVRDEPSLRRVKDVMGHDLVQGVVPCFLKEFGAEEGPDYFDLDRTARGRTTAFQRTSQTELGASP
jgi:hypothetical protein